MLNLEKQPGKMRRGGVAHIREIIPNAVKYAYSFSTRALSSALNFVIEKRGGDLHRKYKK